MRVCARGSPEGGHRSGSGSGRSGAAGQGPVHLLSRPPVFASGWRQHGEKERKGVEGERSEDSFSEMLLLWTVRVRRPALPTSGSPAARSSQTCPGHPAFPPAGPEGCDVPLGTQHPPPCAVPLSSALRALGTSLGIYSAPKRLSKGEKPCLSGEEGRTRGKQGGE